MRRHATFGSAAGTLPLPDRLLAVIDDTPKRYGPKVEGGGIHHNPTPGPADQNISTDILGDACWVRHVLGALRCALGMLYVAETWQDSEAARLDVRHKLVLAAAGRMDCADREEAGKRCGSWSMAATSRPPSTLLLRTGATVIERHSRCCALRPAAEVERRKRRGRGRPRKYGKNRIRLEKRAAHREGWETAECTAYGKRPPNSTRPSWRSTGRGRSDCVVIVLEEHDWYPFFSTDLNATAVEIIEAFADGAMIEKDFHDVKEVWGTGQQQVRNIWTNVAVYHLKIRMYTRWNSGLGTAPTTNFAIAACRRGTTPIVARPTPIAATPCAATSSALNFWPLPLADACREKSVTSSNNCSASRVDMTIY